MELVLEEKGVEKRVRVGNIFIGGVGSGEVRRVQGRFVDGGKKGRKGVRRGLGSRASVSWAFPSLFTVEG